MFFPCGVSLKCHFLKGKASHDIQDDKELRQALKWFKNVSAPFLIT